MGHRLVWNPRLVGVEDAGPEARDAEPILPLQEAGVHVQLQRKSRIGGASEWPPVPWQWGDGGGGTSYVDEKTFSFISLQLFEKFKIRIFSLFLLSTHNLNVCPVSLYRLFLACVSNCAAG